jgi:hypothetical protein
MSATAGRVDGALDYVCLYMPHDQLPAGFSDKVYPSDDGDLSVANNTRDDGPDDDDDGVISDSTGECRAHNRDNRDVSESASAASRREPAKRNATSSDASATPIASGERGASGITPNSVITDTPSPPKTATTGIISTDGAASLGGQAQVKPSAGKVNSAWILRFAEGISSSEEEEEDDTIGRRGALPSSGKSGSSRRGAPPPLDAAAEYAAGLRRLSSLVSDAAAAKVCGDKTRQRELGQQISIVKARNVELSKTGKFNADEVQALVASEQDDAMKNARVSDADGQLDDALEPNASTRAPPHDAEPHTAPDGAAGTSATGGVLDDGPPIGSAVGAHGDASGGGGDSDDSDNIGGVFDVFGEGGCDDDDVDDDNVGDDTDAAGKSLPATDEDNARRFPGVHSWPTRYVTPSWTGKTPRDLLGEVTRALYRGSRPPSFKKGGHTGALSCTVTVHGTGKGAASGPLHFATPPSLPLATVAEAQGLASTIALCAIAHHQPMHLRLPPPFRVVWEVRMLHTLHCNALHCTALIALPQPTSP